MRRLLSFLLALSLAVGLLAGITLTASAEEAAVARVEVTGIPEAKAGEEITVPVIQVPENANYAVIAKWYVLDNMEGYVEISSGTFGYNEYLLKIDVTPKEGCAITEQTEVIIDGRNIHELDGYGWWFEENVLHIEKWVNIEPENGYVDWVVISGAPEFIEPGADIALPEPFVGDGEAAITDAQWLDSEYNAVSGKFEDNKVYYLSLTLVPTRENSAFPNWVEIVVEGFNRYDFYRNTDGTVCVYVRYSLRPTVEQVDITVTEPVIGAAPAAPVAVGDMFTITEYYWSAYYEDPEQALTQFEDNNKYYLTVYLEPAEGYDFANDLSVTVNGQAIDTFDNHGESLDIAYEKSFLKMVERVDITVPEPALGQTPNLEGIKVDGESSQLVHAFWYSYTTGEELTGAFGKELYALELVLEAAEGFEFADDCKIYVNGTEVEELWLDDFYAHVNAMYSFRDVISKIELPAFPELKAGDSLDGTLMQTPEGAQFMLMTQWFSYDSENGMNEYYGQMENGKIYFLMVNAVPNTGYEFAENAQILVDGKEFSTALMGLTSDYVVLLKQYSPGMKVIEAVDLTAPVPEDGKTVSAVTAPADADYVFTEQAWGVSKVDDVEQVETLVTGEDKFAYGNYYWIGFALQAKEGCVFSENVKVTVNGEPVEIDFMNSVFLADAGQVIHGLGELKVAPEDENPKTGDMAPMAAIAAVMLLSAAAMAVTVASKKRYF